MQYTINGNLVNIEHMENTQDQSIGIEEEIKGKIAKCNINSDQIDEYFNLLKNSSVDEKDSEKFGNFMKLLNKINEIENPEISSCMNMAVDDYFVKVPPPEIEGRKDIIETGEVTTVKVEEEESGGGLDLKTIFFIGLLLLIIFYKK